MRFPHTQVILAYVKCQERRKEEEEEKEETKKEGRKKKITSENPYFAFDPRILVLELTQCLQPQKNTCLDPQPLSLGQSGEERL